MMEAVAQLVERQIVTLDVAGSSPVGLPIPNATLRPLGSPIAGLS